MEEYMIAKKKGALIALKEIQPLHCACVHWPKQRIKSIFV